MKVAFIITVYKNDKLEYFKKAITSIVNQDYGFENINIYLGIDGKLSRDIENYIKNNKKLFFKIIKNNENMGLSYTLNRLIERLEDEEYIFRMDSDDICKLDRVSKQVLYMEQNKNIILLGSNITEINKDDKKLRVKKMPIKQDEIIRYSITRNPFNHPTIVFRKNFFRMIGMYNEKIIKSQDYALWAKALKLNVDVANIPDSLVYFRITDNFIQKRNSLINSINEFKVSWSLMIHFRSYIKSYKIIGKFFIRLMPSFFGKFIYKLLRN